MLVTDKKYVIWLVQSYSVLVVCRGSAISRGAKFNICCAESIVYLLQLT